jgi:hypothetical protein
MSASTPSHSKERFVLVEQMPDPQADLCEVARAMAEVCEAMLVTVRQAPDELSVNIALLQLQHQYFLRYEMASKAHRDYIGSRAGHTCIFQVWRNYYSQLRELLLAVNPPPLRPPAPPPARPQINGIFIGEDLGGP